MQNIFFVNNPQSNLKPFFISLSKLQRILRIFFYTLLILQWVLATFFYILQVIQYALAIINIYIEYVIMIYGY